MKWTSSVWDYWAIMVFSVSLSQLPWIAKKNRRTEDRYPVSDKCHRSLVSFLSMGMRDVAALVCGGP